MSSRENSDDDKKKHTSSKTIKKNAENTTNKPKKKEYHSDEGKKKKKKEKNSEDGKEKKKKEKNSEDGKEKNSEDGKEKKKEEKNSEDGKKKIKEYEEEKEKKEKYSKLDKLHDKKNEKGKTFHSTYDIVISIDSIVNSNQVGWDVTFEKKYEKVSKKFEREQIVIGLLGKENVGKTFITNKLCKEDFPSGYYTNTQGLSIKYGGSEKELTAFLDSAGVGGALFFYNKEEMQKYLKENNDKIYKKNFEKVKEKMLKDRILTEYFVQNFILYSCSIIIIVIELMTINDQKMIERIKQFYLEKKKIVIIHNLFKLEDPKQVLKRAEFEIEGSFTNITKSMIPGSENVPYYIEKSKDSKLNNVVHLILGKEKSQSGDFFNEKTLEYLRKLIDTDNSVGKFNIFDKINEYWLEKNQIYITNFTQSLEAPKFVLSKKIIKIEKKIFKGIFRLKTDKDVKLQLISPEFNILGALKENDIKFHLYIKNKPIREKIYLFELPGCVEEPILKVIQRKSLEDDQILTLQIKNPIAINSEYKCISGGLIPNEIVKKIKISDEKGDYVCDKSSINFQGGMLQVKFFIKDENVVNKKK